jgi:Tfp pilus assembly protein PilO
MKLSPRIWACIAMLAVLPVGAWLLYFRPSAQEKAAVLDDLKVQQGQLQLLRQAAGTLAEAEQSAAGLNKAVAFLRAKLPRENEIDKVVKEIWQLAETNRLGLKNIQTAGSEGPAAASAPYPAQMISFQLEGDFAGFYSFLLALESQPRVIRVQKMGVKALESGGQGTGGQGQVQASLLMKVFYEPSAS